MNYFYVSSVIGTRTSGGGYATKQTGSFAALGAANVYASATLAIADGASDDGIMCLSDASANSSSAATITLSGGTTTALNIQCVEDLNCDVESTGGSEATPIGSYDITLNGIINVSGVTLSSGDWLYLANLSGSIVTLNNSLLEVLGSINQFSIAVDGAYVELNSCVFDMYSNSSYFDLSNGSTLVIKGGSFQSTTAGEILNLFKFGFDNGGGNARLTGVDLSVITGYLFGLVGGSRTADDAINIKIDKCKLNAAVNFNQETFTSRNHRILVTQSSSSSAAAEYQYYFHTRGGVVDDSTVFYRDNSTAFAESGQKISLKCTTDANTEIAMPFQFELPSRYAELSVATTDTIRIYLLSSETLTDADVGARLIYADGTVKNAFNTLHSVDNFTSSLRTGVALTAGTEVWTGRTTENRYQIDLDTSGDVGLDCVPIIEIFVAKPSISIYFCTSVDQVT